MKIALDVNGSDEAPASELAGARRALEERDALDLILVGDPASVEPILSEWPDSLLDRVELEPATDRIHPGESPASAVRKRPDSSIVRGIRLQKEGRADAFISAGSTGAVMAASLIFLRPLPGVARPAIGTVLPTAKGPTLMLDAGANVDCKPMHLLQFARLGAIYAQDLMGVPEPRVALLNIGEEPEKGDELSVEAHMLLRESNLNFVGNLEGRDVIQGACDVLVCDGFVGNVLLKFYESVAEFVIGLLGRELDLQGVDLDLHKVFRALDYAEYGGAPLLGVNGVTIICHGKSPPKAIRNAIRVAVQAVESRMIAHIAGELGQSEANSADP